MPPGPRRRRNAPVGARPRGARPQASQRPAAAAPRGGGQYEFNDEENDVVARLALAVRIVGIIGSIGVLIGLVFGVIGLVSNFNVAGVFYLIFLILQILATLSFWGAGNSLRAIVDTSGNDMGNLMQGLTHLSVAFFVQLGIGFLAFLTVLITTIVAMV